MSGHTKGTWRAQSMIQGGIKMFGVCILSADKKSGQRWCAISTTLSLEEEEANARLMAEAPAMLEALREINNTIYAAGLVVGSDEYFKVRGLATDIVNKLEVKKLAIELDI